MMQNDSNPVGAAMGGQTSDPVQILPHARDRWNDRTPAEVSLNAAWADSVTVEAPHANATETRLYPPYDALLVVRSGMLRTVLHNDGRIECPGLITCDACDEFVDPMSSQACPWCGAKLEGTAAHGQVTLTRGDDL